MPSSRPIFGHRRTRAPRPHMRGFLSDAGYPDSVRRVFALSCAVLALSITLVGCAPEAGSEAADAGTGSPAAAPQELQTATPLPSAEASDSPSEQSGVTRVQVVLTTFGGDSEGVYASALIPNIVENGGSCVLEASNGDQVLTAGVSAVAATEATNCGLIRIPAHSGTWRLVLTYSSLTSQGVSDAEEVSVS